MVSGFFTSPCDQSRIFWGAASLIRIESNVMGFACRSRIPQRSRGGLSSLIRLPNGRSVNIQSFSFVAKACARPRPQVACPRCAWLRTLRCLFPVLRDQLHIERQALELLHEHVERLRCPRLEEVFPL